MAMRSPVTAWLIALSRSAARPDHVGQGVNVTGQQGLPIEGVMARAAITYTLFKAPTSPVRGVPAEHRPLDHDRAAAQTSASLAAHALMAIPSNMYPNGFGPFA
jgi:hypothetical protein